MGFTIKNKNYFVTAQPNLSYIVRFEPYRPHSFIPGDASSFLNLTPQNTYNKLVISTTNKISNQLLTSQREILHI